ncbi:zinc finger protein 227 [Elysia marginata]|uniref:Zinc finger protein 227 n=1 Tax=Elysia marginata TaxID=1093978 RepID=A0AAV4H3L3_9GAST|nr:zinc finger protein 227 [Elysia marginata]
MKEPSYIWSNLPWTNEMQYISHMVNTAETAFGYSGENVVNEDYYETQHYTLICKVSDKFYESVIHDCRWIADLLRCQHKISMANIFDTQVANAFVCRSLSGGKWPNNVDSLPICLNNYLNLQPQDVNFSQITEHNDEESEKMWLVRPLPFELLHTATDNAVHLLRLQRILLAEMLVEFKAAVNIYLNYSSGTPEDMKTYRVMATKHLLPIAISYIHTYIKGKCDNRNGMVQETPSMEEIAPLPDDADQTVSLSTESLEYRSQSLVTGTESPDSPNTQSKPIKTQAAANRRKKTSPRKVTRPSAQKSKGFYRNLSKEVFSDDSFTSEGENMDTDMMEYKADFSKDCELKTNLTFSQESSKDITHNVKKSTSKSTGGRRSSSARKTTGRVRLPPRRFPCDMCEMRFPSASALSSHKATHSDERLYKCDICGKSYRTYSTLYSHKLIHSGERPHKCEVCGKCFLVKTALRKHMLMHSDVRDHFKCDICDKSYTSLRGLRIHKEVHTGQRPYKCDVCPKSFTSSSFLIQHKKIHTGNKPFKCPVCEKTFVRRYHLKVHYDKVHCGYKRYCCEMCGKRFVVNADLNVHIKKMHAERNLQSFVVS